jgi:NADH-quinone oxidoreductase subunit M
MQKAFFAESAHVSVAPHEPLPPITIPERLGAIILIVASVIVGLYPQVLLNIIVPALNSPLFNGLRQGGWR